MMSPSINAFLAASLNPKEDRIPSYLYRSQEELDEIITQTVVITVLISIFFTLILFFLFRVTVETRKHNVFFGDYHVVVVKHKSIVQLPRPEKEGYTFGGWYMDKELKHKFPPTKVVDRDLYLYPKWEKNSE